MGYSEILVQTGVHAADTARVRLAADLARRFGSSLAGAHPVPPPPVISGFDIGANLPSPVAQASLMQLAEAEAEEAQHDAAEAETLLRQVAEANGLASRFVTVPDDGPGGLIAQARRADLSVLAGPEAEDVAMACGGPVLIVHPEWEPGPAGERVLVAWNGSRESVRALRDAMPFLKAAKEVEALVVGHADSTVGAEEEVPANLGRHGCKASVLRVPSVDQPVAEVLLRNAKRFDADLIVMGLYGHARLQESMLGGASRDLLRHARVPLLVSH